MRIALWNGSGLDNLGDRLLDLVNRRELGARLPGTKFETFSPWPIPALPFVTIDGQGRWAGESTFDGIVIGGGALLIGPPFIHPTLQTCYLGPYPERFRDSCPVIWNAVCSDSQFVAPLSAPWRQYVQSAASRLTHRSVRNRRTAQMLEECGVTEAVHVVPDPVTLLDRPRSRPAGGRRRRVGLAVGASSTADDFLAHLTSDAGGLDSNPGVRVDVPASELQDAARPVRAAAFLQQLADVFAPLEGRADLEVCAFGAVYGDRATADDVLRVLPARHVVLRDRNGGDALEWIRSLDCLVASRLHACVLAVVAGTPLVALDPYYGPVVGTSKIREFLADADLLANYATTDMFLTGEVSLPDLIETAIADADRLPSVHEGLSARAGAHFDGLADVIRERRPA